MLNANHPLYRQDLEQAANALETKALAGKRVLVTGATGLIGSFLVDVFAAFNRLQPENARLKVTAQYRGPQRLKPHMQAYGAVEGITLVRQDVTAPQPEVGAGEGYDWIIHAAGDTDPARFAAAPEDAIKANVLGTLQLLELARQKPNTRLLFLSSREVYGWVPDRDRFAETDFGLVDFNTLRSGYPEAKRSAELLCRAYAESHGVGAVIARLGFVYGPSLPPGDGRVLAQFLGRALAGQDIILKSDGAQRRSYLYIADAAAALLILLQKGQAGQAYNVAGGPDTVVSIRQMARQTAALAGVRVVAGQPDEAEQKGSAPPASDTLDTAKLGALGWRPQVDFSAGLARTYQILRGGGEE